MHAITEYQGKEIRELYRSVCLSAVAEGEMRIVVEPGLAVKKRRGFWVIDLWLSLVGLGKEWGLFWYWEEDRYWVKFWCSR